MAFTSDGLIVGDDVLYTSFDVPTVLRSRSSNQGRLVAIKIRPPKFYCRTEYDMMHYASENGKAIVPAVYGSYLVTSEDGIREWMVLTSVAVNGIRLNEAWDFMNDEQRRTFREDLKSQLDTFRTMSQPYIGRVGYQHTRNIFDIARTTYMGAFNTEASFDKWCLSRVRGTINKIRFTLLLSVSRTNGPYVLSHLDLRPWNILVDSTTYKLNGKRILPRVYGVCCSNDTGGTPELVVGSSQRRIVALQSVEAATCGVDRQHAMILFDCESISALTFPYQLCF